MRVPVILIAVVIFAGCVHNPQEEIIPKCSASNPLSFAVDVQPVIVARCDFSQCHDGSNPAVPVLNSMDEVKRNSEDILWQITHSAMPPSGSHQLSALEMAEITCWVEQGASNP